MELIRETPRRVLAIYAHPDDSDVSCGGSLAYWAEGGAEIAVVVCADGDKGSTDPEANVDELITTRRAELGAAQTVLGVGRVHHLGRRDGEFENDLSCEKELVAVIRSFRPDVLVCPDPLAVFFGEHYYNHRDHRIVGFAALDAAAPAASSPLYFPDDGEPCTIEVAYLSGSLEANVFVDVTSTIARKADAVLCHRTQLGEASEAMRSHFYDRGQEVGASLGVAFAEAFRRIRLVADGARFAVGEY